MKCFRKKAAQNTTIQTGKNQANDDTGWEVERYYKLFSGEGEPFFVITDKTKPDNFLHCPVLFVHFFMPYFLSRVAISPASMYRLKFLTSFVIIFLTIGFNNDAIPSPMSPKGAR